MGIFKDNSYYDNLQNDGIIIDNENYSCSIAQSLPINNDINTTRSFRDGEIVYSERSAFLLKTGIEQVAGMDRNNSGNGGGLNYEGGSGMAKSDLAPLEYWDIAQSHFFTVEISNNVTGAGLHDGAGVPFRFASGKGTYKNYVPLKTMNFNYTSYENMSIPFGIFGDFPLLHRKKVTTISFSCYDIDQDSIEKALRNWEQECFPEGLYVAYMADVTATLKYVSYDVKGKMNFTRYLEVIPASSVSVSRSYEENGAKMLNFSVVAVGSSGANAISGEGSSRQEEYPDQAYKRVYGVAFNRELSGVAYEQQVNGEVITPDVRNRVTE